MSRLSILPTVILLKIILLISVTGCAHHTYSTSSGTMASHYVLAKQERKNTAIVFVHGVVGESESTWTNDITRAYWPKLLANDPDFDDANVYVFQYPSTTFEKSLTVNEVSELMRSRLQADGVLQHSQLVFISHSMGGLITRSFLLKYREYAAKVRFAYFYATPTEGSPMATIASLVSRNPQFKNLYPLEADNYLGDLQRDWLAAQLGIPSYCSYEGRTTFGILVVDQRSAAGLCTEPLTPIDENHIDIVKPATKNSDSYIAFKNAYNSNQKTTSKEPKYVGRLRKTSRLIFSTKDSSNVVLEIGDSGTKFLWLGPKDTPMFQLFDNDYIEIYNKDGDLKVSTIIRNKEGNVVAELVDNEWKVSSNSAVSFDRNYSKEALEVKDGNGDIVLQVKLLEDRVQLQGKFYGPNGQGFAIGRNHNISGRGVIEILGAKHKTFDLKIKPLFRYPSEFHLGELIR
jgi:pimeloyl-ACP methyl ester carboxylesterase